MKKKTLFGLTLLLSIVMLFTAFAESTMAKEYADQIDRLFDQYGNFEAWSAEQRAELSAIEEKAGCHWDGSPLREIYRVPDSAKGEIDEESARKLAQEALAKESVAASRHTIAYAAYYALAEKPEETMWEVLFEAPVGLYSQTVFLSAKGSLLRIETSDTPALYDAEGRFITGILKDKGNVFPSTTDIPARRAAEIAVSVYNQTMGASKKNEELSVTGGLKELNGQHFWYVRLFDGSLPPETDSGCLFDTVVDAKSEHVLYHPEADTYRRRAESYQRGVQMQEKFKKDGCFLTWSLEDQKAMWPDLLALPEEGDLSMDEARTAARQALQRETGLSDRFFDRHHAYLMLENSTHAPRGKAWHVAFALPEDLPNGSLVPTNIYGFNVWVDAASGQMLKLSTPREMAFCAHFYQYDDGTGTTALPMGPAEEIALGLPCPATGFAISRDKAEEIAREAILKACPELNVQDYVASVTHVLQHMQEYFVVTLENEGTKTLTVAMRNDGTVASHTTPEKPAAFDSTFSPEKGREIIHWALSVEEKAAYMPDTYGLPKEGELTEKEAVDIAAQAIKKHYALTDADIEQLVATSGVNLHTTRRWEINFFPKEQVENNLYSDSYWVDIDIVTGDLLCYHSPSESNG